MSTLTQPQKIWIVMRLAQFDPVSEVVRSFFEEWGVVASKQQVSAYDPATLAGETLSDELKALFRATRAKHIEELLEIPLSHRATRMRRLDRAYEKASRRDDLPNMMRAVDLARKECESFELFDDDPTDDAPALQIVWAPATPAPANPIGDSNDDSPPQTHDE